MHAKIGRNICWNVYERSYLKNSGIWEIINNAHITCTYVAKSKVLQRDFVYRVTVDWHENAFCLNLIDLQYQLKSLAVISCVE